MSNRIDIYTDASVKNGFAARAAVVYTNGHLTDFYGSRTKKKSRATSTAAETWGVFEMIKHYLSPTQVNKWNKLVIHTDSSHVISRFETGKIVNDPLVPDLSIKKKLRSFINDPNCMILKCTAHAGDPGNELADKVAKYFVDSSKTPSRKEITSYLKDAHSNLFKEATKITLPEVTNVVENTISQLNAQIDKLTAENAELTYHLKTASEAILEREFDAALAYREAHQKLQNELSNVKTRYKNTQEDIRLVKSILERLSRYELPTSVQHQLNAAVSILTEHESVEEVSYEKQLSEFYGDLLEPTLL